MVSLLDSDDEHWRCQSLTEFVDRAPEIHSKLHSASTEVEEYFSHLCKYGQAARKHFHRDK